MPRSVNVCPRNRVRYTRNLTGSLDALTLGGFFFVVFFFLSAQYFFHSFCDCFSGSG